MKHGFTLLELSIVLVIIGLIIGGITVGADMIRSAELNAVVSEKNKFQIALNTFKLKYNAKPGDMKNATSYWPTAGTANGNGNGNFFNGSNDYAEGLLAWQHLGLSEIISGTFAGAGARGINVTYPPSALTAHGWQFTRMGSSSSTCTNQGDDQLYAAGAHDILMFAIEDSNNGNCLSAGALDVTSAHAIDLKTDDGIADKGKTLGTNNQSDSTGCAGQWNTSITNGSYNLADTTNNCRLVFLID